MDIGRAFSFVIDDDEWVKKIAIGGVISLIPIVGSFVISGYSIEVARRAFTASGVDELPDWDDFGGYLTRGFLYSMGVFIWYLPVFLLISCAILAAVLLGVATGDGAVIGVSVVLVVLALTPIILLLSLAGAVIFPVLLGRFACHQRFSSLFEFGEIIADLRRIGVVPMLLLIGTTMAASYLGQLGFILCFVGVVFTGFYANIVAANAAGQTYRLAQGLEPVTAPVQGLGSQPVGS